MELWIVVTLLAAALQNLRSAMQRHLRSMMGTTGATFARFGYGVPMAAGFVLVLHYGFDFEMPRLNLEFGAWVLLGGLAQIAGTFLLVHLFTLRNFAVGTAYSRTEPAQAAIFGLVFLSEKASPLILAAIAISVVGVMLISVARMAVSPRTLVTSVMAPSAVLGLTSGMMFGIAAVSFRAASLSLGGPHFLMQAGTTLFVAITLQTMVMMLWMVLREPEEIGRVLRAWKPALIVGAAGSSASFCWFIALTLQQASLVKALGQIEIIFTFASSVIVFRESINRLEVIGCLLIVGGILVLVLL